MNNNSKKAWDWLACCFVRLS